MIRTCIVLCFYVVCICVSSAQTDTLLVVGPDVVLTASTHSDMSKRRLGTTGALHQSLSDISSIQIQQLAPGGLATAINGASAARHLALLWEGWSIQSPVNGTYDLSLVPMSIFNASEYIDRVQLQGSGTSAHRGVIELSSTDHDYLSYTYDTWNDHIVALAKTINIGKGKLSIQSSGQLRDLAYRYDRFGMVERQDAASQRGEDLQATYDLALSPYLSLSIGTWWQNVERDLAPSKTAANAGEVQTDDNRRTSARLSYRRGKHYLETRAAYFDEYIHYRSNVVDSKADNYASMVATTYKHAGKHPTTIEVLLRRDLIRSTFDINTARNTLQLFVGKDFVINERLRLSTGLRQDLIDRQWQPTTLSARANYTAGPIALELQHSYSYTPPTLNDLYWPQLGNPELRTEQGSLTSLQARTDKVIKHLDIGITAHYQVVDDWILWSPDSGGIWRPSNARDVIANSLVLDVNYTRPLSSQSSITLRSNLSYGPTTTLDARTNTRKQLIYTPRYRHTAAVSYTRKRWSSQVSMRHTGKRYADTNNTNVLDPFTLVDTRVSYTFTNDIKIAVDIFNLLDERYEIVPFFPTSLRHLSFQIIKPI